MIIREYEQHSGGNIHIDYANDLFLDFAFENGYVAASDYDKILRRELEKKGFPYAPVKGRRTK